MLLSHYCTNAQGLATSFQHRCPCSSVASVSVCWAKEDVPFALFCSMRATSDPYYSGNASGTDSYGQVQQHIGFVAEVLILVSCLARHAPQSPCRDKLEVRMTLAAQHDFRCCPGCSSEGRAAGASRCIVAHATSGTLTLSRQFHPCLRIVRMV